MIKGLYTAASGMLATSFQMDTLANNLANVNTTGFKKNGINFQSFPELLIQRIDAQGTQQVGSLTTGSKVRSTAMDFTQGAIRQTGNPLDLALQGDGFFSVTDEAGNVFYTRNGTFTISPEGELVTVEGYRVLAHNDGRFNMPDRSKSDIKITDDGTVSVGGQVLGQIKVTQFENNHALEKRGENFFVTTDASRVRESHTVDDESAYQVFQGSIEMSNVNVVSEMVSNITGMRLYESLQKNIQLQNQTLEKAVNEVGRYR